jgi:hypothetical protein
VRAAFRDAVFLSALTAYGSPEDRQRAYEAGLEARGWRTWAPASPPTSGASSCRGEGLGWFHRVPLASTHRSFLGGPPFANLDLRTPVGSNYHVVRDLAAAARSDCRG